MTETMYLCQCGHTYNIDLPACPKCSRAQDRNTGKHQPFEYDPTKITTKSGSGTSKTPPFHHLPLNGLKCAAMRFDIGQVNYAEKAYSYTTSRQSLTDRDWLVNRCNHAIEHLYNIIRHLKSGDLDHDVIQDAGAVAWCGLMLGDAFWRDDIDANPT